MTTKDTLSGTSSPLDLDRQICHSLYSAANALVRAYRPYLAELDLTYPQYVVMMSLWQRDGVSITDLVGHTRFDAGTLTPLLRRLQGKGLVDIRVADSDERRRVVTLTRQGRSLKAAAKELPARIACTVDMSEDEALELKALCETLLSKLSTGVQRD